MVGLERGYILVNFLCRGNHFETGFPVITWHVSSVLFCKDKAIIHVPGADMCNYCRANTMIIISTLIHKIICLGTVDTKPRSKPIGLRGYESTLWSCLTMAFL